MDDVAHAGGHADAADHLALGQLGVGGVQAGQLGHEERVAVGAPVDGAAPRRRRRPRPTVSRTSSPAAARSRPRRCRRRAVGRRVRSAIAWTSASLRPDLQLAHRGDEQHGRADDVPGEELDQLERRPIRPLQVVERDHQPAVPPGLDEQLGERLVDLVAAGVGLVDAAAWPGGPLQLGDRVPVRLGQLGGDVGQPVDRPHPRPERG